MQIMAVKPIKSTFGKIGRRYASNYHNSRSGSNEFYAGGRNDQRRLSNGQIAKDINEMMSQHRHKMMLCDSRYIFQSFSSVSGAVNQKANYVYGGSWRLQSGSADNDFADAVEEDFKRLDRMFDIRGSSFSFRKNVWRGSKMLDVDGDFFVILTEQDGTQFPKLQFIESHKVGDWGDSASGYVTDSKKYAGRKIQAGVIYDDYMAPIAYRVKDDSRSAGWQDIPANNIVHFCDMEWYSQGRGIPSISNGVLDWYDLSETRDAQKVKVKSNSMLTMVESNESGTRDINREMMGMGGTSTAPATTYMDSGMVRVIKNGGSLKAHTSNDPSDGWMSFTKRIEQSAFYALGWRREMLDSSDVGGAGVRGFAADINKSIAARREVLESGYVRLAQYIIAKRAKMGAYTLPSDWWKVSFTRPPEFTVDEGRMRAADIEDLRAGLITATDIVQRRGQDFAEQLVIRAKEIKKINDCAAEYGIDAAELSRITRPGDIVAGQQSSEGGEDESSEAESDALNFTNLKAKFDAYGTGVRGGVITPQKEDEDAFRIEAGLPTMGTPVQEAWVEDGGYRRPITLQSGTESEQAIREQQSNTENND